jgi:hypothetical protein
MDNIKGLTRNVQLREEFQNLRMQKVSITDAVEFLAEKHGMNPSTLRGIVCRKHPTRSAHFTEDGGNKEIEIAIDGDSFIGKATSTLYGKDGKEILKWVKRSRSDEQRAAHEMISALSEPLPKVRKSEPRSKTFRPDTIAVYPMGDPHFGLFSWGEETGADFDLKIAERDLCSAVQRLVDTVPACEEALIINLGDFYHADNANSRTQSGHVLDTDTRWAKVLRVGIKAMRQCIESALAKHRTVHVINAIGNHDEHTSLFVTVALSNIYENEPRVRINASPAVKHYHRFGKNLFAVHHGHTIKPEAMPLQMALDRPADWAECPRRRVFMGHVHHLQAKEIGGVIVESFRTLAPKDAWHASMGYQSERDMRALLFHAEFGEVERHVVTIDMLEASYR